MPSSPIARPPAAALWPATQYGNKTANLERLNQWLGADARVPPFVGISHDAILQMLGRDVALDIVTLQWALGEQAKSGKEGLSATVRQSLATLRDRIDLACTQLQPEDLSKPLETFLRQHVHQRLMVRSSGAEDSALLANAGGNYSAVNVANEKTALQQAFSQVLQSYFSERSFQQRMLAGDMFEDETKLSVLVQVMVGESPSTKKPISSGVMFTTEGEAFTEGVSHIQSAYGHNDAVVQSLLPADSFYLQGSDIHSVVRYKPTRLAPGSQGRMVERPNPASQRMQPAIGADVLRRLQRVGERAAKEFGQPVDMEWTYDAEADALFIVQARPLIEQEIGEPSHIAPQFLKEAAQLSGKLIGAGGGYVRLIDNEDQVIFAQTLAAALPHFFAKHENEETVELVVVAQGAEPTSHEATVFRGAQIPVLQTADLEAAKSFVGESGRSLFDPSLQAIVTSPQLFVDDKIADEAIVAGWGRHPLSAERSVSYAQMQVTDAKGFIAQLARQAKLSESEAIDPLTVMSRQAISYNEFNPPKRPSDAIEAMRVATSEQERAQAALSLLAQASRYVALLQSEPFLAQRAKRVMQQIVAATEHAIDAKANGQELPFLFHLNTLFALAEQSSMSGTIGADSLLGLLAERQEVRALTQSTGAAGETQDRDMVLRLSVERFSHMAMRPDVKAFFFRVTKNIQQSETGRRVLASILGHVQQTGISALWVTSLFDPEGPLEGVTSAREQLAVLSEGLSPDDGNTRFAAAKNMRQAASSWQQRLTTWAQPSEFDAQKKAFLKDVQTWVFKTALTQYGESTPMQKAMLLSSMEQFVESFDRGIKTISASPAYTPLQKAAAIRRLLLPFADMLAKSLPVVAPKLAKSQGHAVSAGVVAEYMAKDLSTLFKETLPDALGNPRLRVHHGSDKGRWPVEKALQPTAGFNVQSAIVGGPTMGSGYGPESMEDYFTTIHQSLVHALSAARMEAGMSEKTLPSHLQHLLAHLQKSSDSFGRAAHITSIMPAAHHVDIDLNRPMREHGIHLRLSMRYDSPNRLQASISYFSRINENFRINRAMLAAGLISAALRVPFVKGKEPVYQEDRRELAWAWDFDVAGDKAQQVGVLLQKFFAYQESTSKVGNKMVPLEEQLEAIRQFVPTLDAVVDNLPAEFFRNMPWYNDEFARYFEKNDKLKLAGFRHLASVIVEEPKGQDELWQPQDRWAYAAVKSERFHPKAPKTLSRVLERARLAQQAAQTVFAPIAQPKAAVVGPDKWTIDLDD